MRRSLGPTVSRRHVLRSLAALGGGLAAGGLLQACTPAAPAAGPSLVPSSAAPSPSAQVSPAAVGSAAPAQAQAGAVPAAPADWQQQWDALQAAAKQEGQVAVIVPPGDVYRTLADQFQSQYGVQVQLLAGNGTPDIAPQVAAERTAGQFNWDVVAHSPGVQFVGFYPIGAMDPLAPALILPEILDDSKWFQGFQAGWADLQGTTTYGFVGFADATAKINRSIVPESELGTLDQLWDPQWKGKIAMYDPRIGGAGLQAAAVWLLNLGPDKLQQFFETQQPTLTQDRRQLGEWLVRGEYPIGVGVSPDSLSPLSTEGVDISQIKPLDPQNPNGIIYSIGTGSLGLMNKAPHPNAAKLFANWLLTQPAQQSWGTLTLYDSRRLDVPPADPTYAPVEGTSYLNIDVQKNYSARDQTTTIAKAALG